KEKVLAARRAGITEIILPKMNEKDLRDIEPEVIRDLTIHYVENIGEVIGLAFPEAGEEIEPYVHYFDVCEKAPLKPGLRP
ncbi:MAG TPA: hypothetical protein PK213_15815, partial [Deltaproteobacteria bacterium]|nr:hypothetical protein [Deltaproteobacteria bacterium]